jgi:hypothetical protein
MFFKPMVYLGFGRFHPRLYALPDWIQQPLKKDSAAFTNALNLSGSSPIARNCSTVAATSASGIYLDALKI